MKKTAIVTGASRGIGRAIALALAENGYNLVITNSKDPEEIRKIVRECKEAGAPYCHAFTGDLGDPKNVSRLFMETAVSFGGADILINNAGISHVGLITDETDEGWMSILNTNLSSVFYCCKAAIPYMRKVKSGQIINISSVWGTEGASCEVAYSATKGGVNALTKALAKELAPSGIRVNALALGAIDTSMNSHLTEEERKALEEEIPMGRYGTPQEVGQAVLKLLEMPEYFTGQIVTLNGGWQ